MDLIEKCSTHLKTVFTRACAAAVHAQEPHIYPEYLLWALGTQKGSIAAEILKKVGVKPTDLKSLITTVASAKSSPLPKSEAILHLSEDAGRALEKALLTATQFGHAYIGTEHLLNGLIRLESPGVTRFFERLQIPLAPLQEHLTLVFKNTAQFPGLSGAATEATVTTPQSNTETLAESFPILSQFARELTSAAAQATIDPVIGREEEITRLMEILSRRTKNNPLLLGEPGVGKTAVVEGLAKRLFEGDVPSSLKHKRLFALDLPLLIAGTMYRGEFEGRLKQLLEEVSKSSDIILFIDELHTIVGAGAASGTMDVANILKPALARGEIRCIGATTHAEFKKHIEPDNALERRFQPISVDEPTEATALEIIKGLAPYYETFHHVTLTDEALKSAVHYSVRHLIDRQLPDKAIDLIDEASAAARMQRAEIGPAEQRKIIERELAHVREEKRRAVTEERFTDAETLKGKEDALLTKQQTIRTEWSASDRPMITKADIARVVARMAHIPVDDVLAHSTQTSADIEQALSARVHGQTDVIQQVAKGLIRAKMGFGHPKKPLASFLFLGPSGVGKTELAKTIAEQFFHHPSSLIRLDMSEYAEGFTAAKLLGAPAGYIGYKEQTSVTDRIRKQPHSVVLFDEIEKAHPDVQNLLLQILEEGELADGTGKMVNFKHAIVILTSNVGLERFERGSFGFMESAQATNRAQEHDIAAELKERFRPELLSRLDHTCLFRPLTKEARATILDAHVQDLTDRLRTKHITLVVPKSVRAHLLDGQNETRGARGLRQMIQTHLEPLIADTLIQHATAKKITIGLEATTLVARAL